MCSFFIPPPSFGTVEAGIYRCSLPSPLSQVYLLVQPVAHLLIYPLAIHRRLAIATICKCRPRNNSVPFRGPTSRFPAKFFRGQRHSYRYTNGVSSDRLVHLFFRNVACCKRHPPAPGAVNSQRKRGAPREQPDAAQPLIFSPSGSPRPSQTC